MEEIVLEAEGLPGGVLSWGMLAAVLGGLLWLMLLLPAVEEMLPMLGDAVRLCGDGCG